MARTPSAPKSESAALASIAPWATRRGRRRLQHAGVRGTVFRRLRRCGLQPVHIRRHERGHDAGDRVLVEVARRLQAGLRHGDVVARIGGDEFVALLPGCDADAAHTLVEAMHAQLALPVELDGGPRRIAASIGAAACPADGCTADVLLDHADAAMYAAKRASMHARDPG